MCWSTTLLESAEDRAWRNVVAAREVFVVWHDLVCPPLGGTDSTLAWCRWGRSQIEFGHLTDSTWRRIDSKRCR